MKLTRIGVDIAKQVFQLHGTNRSERTVWRRRLPRDRWLQALGEVAEPGCEIGMSLGTATASAGLSGEADRAAVREALREEQQERRQ